MISRYLDRTAAPAADPLARKPQSRAARMFLWAFSICMLLTAGGAFIFKLVEFIYSFTTNPTVRFSLIPILTYLIVAAGFGCLFMWAYLSGQFKDVEEAKYRMLEMQREIDARE
jgi:cbb3-type cytochrome oxidase maturation protein